MKSTIGGYKLNNQSVKNQWQTVYLIAASVKTSAKARE